MGDWRYAWSVYEASFIEYIDISTALSGWTALGSQESVYPTLRLKEMWETKPPIAVRTGECLSSPCPYLLATFAR
jgi:hypothetical protein